MEGDIRIVFCFNLMAHRVHLDMLSGQCDRAGTTSCIISTWGSGVFNAVIVCAWVANSGGLVVDPKQKVAWAIRVWELPNLNPCSNRPDKGSACGWIWV